MDNTNRDRANKYAQLYRETKSIRTFKERVRVEIGRDFLEEATIVWEAIDQWEGEHRPA